MAGTADRPQFWRCPACSTPNPASSFVTTCVACGLPRPRDSNAAFEPDPKVARPTAARRRPWTWTVGFASVAYGLILLAVYGLKSAWGDLWWPATLLLYAPQLPWLVPVAVLALLNGGPKLRWAWGVQAASAAFVLIALMGLNLPIGDLMRTSAAGEGTRLRVMTINRGVSGEADDDVDTARMIALVEREQPDIILLQEGYFRAPFRDPALESYFREGWSIDSNHFVLSRHPIVDERPLLRRESAEFGFYPAQLVRVRVTLPDGASVWVASVHLPSVRRTFDWVRSRDFDTVERFQAWRLAEAEAVREAVTELDDAPVVVAGDFNAPISSPVMAPFLVGLKGGFPEAGWGYGYTRPSAWPWIKIDHVLADDSWRFERCWVGPDVGSDHLPIIADLRRVAPFARTSRAKTP